MSKQEVRNHVDAELAKRGIKHPHTISNKEACKVLGLMPENVVGIGSVNGAKLLRAWYEGKVLSYEDLGGWLREQEKPSKVKFTPQQLTGHSKKELRAKRRKRLEENFYDSQKWKETRYMALQIHGGKCMCCGRGAKEGAIVQVDHIKPRSLFPELELDLNNLQVLCRDCNFGKSNKDQTDWRQTNAGA